MPCMWCGDLGYWECGEVPPADLCEVGETMIGYGVKPWVWTFVEQVELEEGTTYYTKCRPGGPCGAIVDEDADPPSPWDVVGVLSVPEDLAAGPYDVYCRVGHGEKCRVRLHPSDGASGK